MIEAAFGLPFFVGDSQGFAHCVRTSLPACGGAMQNTIKKSRSSKLDAIFHCVLRRERD